MKLAEILEPVWLETHVFADQPNLRVVATEEVWREENTATKVRVALTLDNARPGTPTAICIKGMLDESGGKWLSSGTSVTESRFYAQMAPQLVSAGVNLPDCLYTAIDPESGHGLLIMKDMVADGATFLTALTPYTPDQARDSLAQLARLHVATGPGKPLHDAPVAGLDLARMADAPMIPFDLLQELMDGPRGDPLPTAVRDTTRLHRSLSGLLAMLRDEPRCIVHGDAHSGNLYRHKGGAGIIDWQIVQQGHWSQDVAYHIVTALTVEDRRANEESLLAHYLAERAALGDPVASPERAAQHYRASILYGFYLWAVTRRVRPDIILELVKRLGLAVADHGSFALVGA
ncbi:MAG: aminoglycoside phosphotransferase family protein [Sphingobium sp.]